MERRRTLTQYPSLAATARSSVNPGLALLCCWRRSSVVNTAQPILNTKRILSIMRRYSIDSNADREQTEVCCEYCDEWSVLPDGISSNDSPGEWYCNACKKQEC